jgi:hypothetical protein
VPLPRGVIRFALSRPARNPEKQAISQTFWKTREVVSAIGKFTFAPMLKTQTSTGAISASTFSKRAIIWSSCRASTPNG